MLSEFTEQTDRGDKLLCYQTLPSLAIYVIVAQDRPPIQVYERQSNGSWLYSLHQGLEATPLKAQENILQAQPLDFAVAFCVLPVFLHLERDSFKDAS